MVTVARPFSRAEEVNFETLAGLRYVLGIKKPNWKNDWCTQLTALDTFRRTAKIGKAHTIIKKLVRACEEALKRG